MTIKARAPFNPLDKKHLGESVGQAMLRQPVVPLAELRPFAGAGIYAIYYSGDFPAYKAIAERNSGGHFEAPIYVGSSVPTGTRKGNPVENSPGRVLYRRLIQHARSIKEVENLQLHDFHCRYLIVDDIWIPLGEALLIAKFNPLWNKLVDGFGNHNPGKGRHAGLRPRWDTVHPGRAWAVKCQERLETSEQIMREAKECLRNNPPPDDINLITG
jgi:hypothetical protein